MLFSCEQCYIPPQSLYNKQRHRTVHLRDFLKIILQTTEMLQSYPVHIAHITFVYVCFLEKLRITSETVSRRNFFQCS